MQTFGSDRFRRGEGTALLLECRLDKGWKGRVEKTLTSAEFPGTAVEWDGAFYEVIRVEYLANGGVRYVFLPWRDEHAMRVVDRYDEATEAARLEAYRAELRRQANRKTVVWLGIFTGHLPAIVQRRLGDELGTTPHRLTMLSAFPLMVICGPLLLLAIGRTISGEATYPLPVLMLLGWTAAESFWRFNLAFSQATPCGSLEGFLVYGIWWAIRGRARNAPSPFAKEKGLNASSVAVVALPHEIETNDLLIMREPLLTLLTPAEQQRLMELYGYDYRRSSTSTAVTLLVFSLLGVLTSFVSLSNGRVSALIGLFAAGIIAGEQVLRLRALRNGPAASVLAVLARPIVKKLLHRQPPPQEAQD